MKIIFKYTLVAQILCAMKKTMDYIKNDEVPNRKPNKYYEWKAHTEAIDDENLTRRFIEEYKETAN